MEQLNPTTTNDRGEYASPEEIEEVRNFIPKIEKELQKSRSMFNMHSLERKKRRGNTFGEILRLIEDSGVDINDPTAVSLFINKIRAVDPQLADAFTYAIEHFLPLDEENPE